MTKNNETMVAIVGAAGNVGLATASALRDAGVPVRAVLHSATHTSQFEALGCEVAIADLQEPASLARGLVGVERVQVVVPLRPKTPDPVRDMHLSVTSIVTALAEARPARILAISDYGAHVAEDVGMPTIFRAFEERLSRLDARVTILRSAEHMHTLARGIPAALESGTMATFQEPVDALHPLIAAQDLGVIAAGLLRDDEPGGVTVYHAEGPRRYSAVDEAAALGTLAGRPIEARPVPRSAWQETLERSMPPTLAPLLIRTNDAKNAGGAIDVEPGGRVLHGTTELIDALRPLLPH